MQRYRYIVGQLPQRGEGQDRVAVFERDGSLIIALADGAGGTSNGEIAAQAVVDAARTATDDAFSDLLLDLEADPARLQGGQTTAIILSITEQRIYGASVGDSEAWLVDPDQRMQSLTRHQQRKPLLGSGAMPVPTVELPLGTCTLVVASDGLFTYAKQADVARIAVGADLDAAAAQLIDLVRTPAGSVMDDVTVVLCRASVR